MEFRGKRKQIIAGHDALLKNVDALIGCRNDCGLHKIGWDFGRQNEYFA